MAEPFGFADFTWLNGNPRTRESPLGGKVFTGEFRVDTSYIFDFAHPADHTLGGLGPFKPEEAAAFASCAFMGSESMYLLGIEKKGSPVRQALRRFGDLIRIAEAASSKR